MSNPEIIEIKDKKPTLEELQTLVGGLIQEVYKTDGLNTFRDPKVQYWVNEEGLIHKLPYNAKAALILGQPIVGNLVILTEKAILD